MNTPKLGHMGHDEVKNWVFSKLWLTGVRGDPVDYHHNSLIRSDIRVISRYFYRLAKGFIGLNFFKAISFKRRTQNEKERKETS